MSNKPCPDCGKPIDYRGHRCRSCNKNHKRDHHIRNCITASWIHRKYGYREIVVDGRRMPEHRYVMEKILGRKLERNEVVHHKDGNRLNNIIENLEVMTLSEHSKMHMKRIGFPKLSEDAEKRRKENAAKSHINGYKKLVKPRRDPEDIRKEHSEKMKLWWSNHK